MATITLRSVKGSPLTNAEVDANFSNINTELGTKLSATGGTLTGGITVPSVTLSGSGGEPGVATLTWNDTAGTLDLGLKGGNVTMQIGEELFLRVTNSTGSAIPKGSVVYITSSTGSHVNVVLSQANSEGTSSKTLGITAEAIANAQTGFVATNGIISGLDTSALTEGGAVWLSATVAGGLTSTRPSPPNHAVLIGWCVKSHASVGALYVHIANGYEVAELHDVLLTSIANNQVLSYESASGLWKNRSLATVANTGAFSDILSKPTTLSGYGITDAPTVTGTGASGTWGISITGNAATVTNGVYTNTAQTISGVKTFSNGLIIGNTAYANYEGHVQYDADAAGTWKRIAQVVVATGQYQTIGFRIEVLDPQANHMVTAAVDDLRTEIYDVACVRTQSTVQDTPDACYVRGPGSRIRATKTATGTYEIHIQNDGNWREYKFRAFMVAVNGAHTVNWYNGDTASEGTAQYAASVSTTSRHFFQNVTARQITSNVATGTAPFAVSSTTRVANLNVATAGTADAFTTGRTISLTGDVTGTSGNFDGSANLSFAATLANSGVAAGTYGGNNSIPSITFDAKGRATAASTVTPSGTWGISITGTSRGVGTTDPLIGTGGLWVTSATGLNVARNGTAYVALDAGNYSSYALPLTGGTLTGALTAPNFRDSAGAFNVNLGSGGTEGRGAAVGYSGGAYGGIGYNVRHTATSEQYVAPTGDTVSYLRFDGGGFRFFSAAAGAAGRTVTFSAPGNAHLDASGNWYTAGQMYATGSQHLVLNTGNYNSYAPTLTGTGASGSWGISVTGNAGTATTLQTARTINGTSFNGSANITTANWGTARTITIGSTGKSVDGSGNVSWTLGEIGAVGSGNTMTINAEYSGTVAQNQTGWYTIASYGSGRAEATFHLSDQDSSRHNYVRANIVWSFGYGGIVVDTSGRHGVSTIRNIRLLYNTSDRTYGGVKVQVYCEGTSDQAWSLRVRQETTTTSGWGNFTEVTPVLEGTPAGWAEGYQAYYVNEQGQISTSSSSAYFAGNLALHAGNYSSYALPLSGGTLTGVLSFSNSGTAINLSGQSDTFGYNATAGLGTYIKGTGSTWLYGGGSFYDGAATRTLLHSGNYGSYALPLSGGTLSSTLSIANANPVLILKDSDNSGTGAGQVGYISFQDSGNVERAWIGYGSGGNTDLSVWNTRGDVVLGAASGVARVNSNTIIHSGNYGSYALPLGGGTLTGGLNVGTAIGSRATSLSVSGSTNSSAIAAKSSDYATVFGVLPHSGSYTYFSTGVYYQSGTWVHASANDNSALFSISGNLGAQWWASSNSSASWNLASGASLWNVSGTWIGALNAASGAQVNGSTIWHAGNFTPGNYLALSGGTLSGTLSVSSAYGTMAAVKGSYFGYSSGYGAIVLGSTASNQTTCIGVDPIGNPSGSFSGLGHEVMFRNGVMFITPTSGNNSYHNYLNLTDGSVVLRGGIGSDVHGASSGNAVVRTSAPAGAAASWDNLITGAIKIRLPVRYNNTMWRMSVKIYDYYGSVSEYHIGNYSYDAGGYNSAAHFIGSAGAEARTVRLGNDGSYDCVWIGETNTVWSHPVISVTDFTGGFRYGNTASWGRNWDIGYVTSFGTVAAAISPITRLATGSTVNANAILHAGNYSSYALPLSGGTLTGGVTFNAGVYMAQNGQGAGASSTLRVNGDITAARSNGASGVIYLGSGGNTYVYYDGSNYYMPGGQLYVNGVITLNSGNYNDYAPTKTGSGAYGTWGISISGTASYATNVSNSRFDNYSGSYNNAYTWLQFHGGTGYGLYFPGSGSMTHLYPSSTSYGSVYIEGARGGYWGTMYGTGAGNAGWMTNSNTSGFYNHSAGWKYYHESGRFFSSNTSAGGGNFWSMGLHNNNNPSLYSSVAGAMGLLGADSNGTYRWQLYGDGSSYGFLQSAWGAWDLQKAVNGQLLLRVSGTDYTALHSGNYNSYAPTLTGGGASGSWNITAARATRANGNFYIDDNYGNGVVGVYASTRYQGVFAMGDSYKLPADGTSAGNLYGLAWSYPSAGGVAGNLDSHGLLVLINGGLGSAISYSIVAAGNVTAYSDERLKTNWRPMPENFVERLAQVKVGIYDRIDGEQITQVGIGAQSFQKLLPEAITKAKDEMGTLSVSYGNAAMASAVELAKEIIAIKRELEALKARLH